MIQIFKKLWSNEDGNFGILGAIGTSAILATTALAVDSSSLYNSKASVQSALDAATLAASYGTPDEYNAVATEVFDQALGIDRLKNRNINVTRDGDFLVGTATGTASAFFGGVLMPETVNIGAFTKVGFSRKLGGETDETEESGAFACIISLKQNNRGLTLNSGAQINAPGCEVHVHAQRNGVTYNNGVRLDISKLCISGSNFGPNNGRLPQEKFELNCDAAPDPYVDAYPEYNAAGCDYNHFNPDSLGRRNNRRKMKPGVYCGHANFNSGKGTFEMEPGVYVIKNGGWNVNGGNQLKGEGVTFYYEDRSVIQFNSGASLDISAPTSGDYENFVMIQKPGLRSGNRFILNGGNHMTMTGIIHLPTRDVTLNSGSRNTSTALIAREIIINSGARLNITPESYFPRASQDTDSPQTGQGSGSGTSDGDNSDLVRVASSEGVPYIVR